MQRVYDKARAIFCDFIDKIPGIRVIHHFMCTARLHNECRSGKGRVYGYKWAWYLHFISRIEIQLSIGIDNTQTTISARRTRIHNV